jgi:hypothetical protein
MGLEPKCKISSAEQKTLSLSDLLFKWLRELAESQYLHVHDPDAASKTGDAEHFTFRMPMPQFELQGCPRAPCSDTEVSCGLELVELEPHEHESELCYGSPTPEPGAEPVEPIKPEVEFDVEFFDDEAEPAPVSKRRRRRRKGL